MIRQMYAEIQKQTGRHSVRELCSIYGVSRSGYYKWLKRAGQVNRYEKTHEILDRYVSDIHAHHPMMGCRQIRDKLRIEFGWSVSDPTVWKSMRRLKIHGYTRRQKTAAAGSNMEHIRYPNVLNRNFKAEKPMQKIVTDVTYIKHNGKWHYLAGHLDLFNNEIVEWELSDAFDNFLVIQSMSRAGNPRDNAVMESFWGRFKGALRKHFCCWEHDDLRATIERAIYYFNNERPVRKLKGKPPVLFRTELVA